MLPLILTIVIFAKCEQAEAQLVKLPPPDEYVKEFKNHPNWNLLPHELDCGRDISRSTYHDDDPDPNPFDDPPPPSKRRIFGGKDAERWEFPWMVGFYLTDYRLEIGAPSCGGAIISRKYVITAGHCCVDEMKKKVAGDAFIQVGGHSRNHTNSQCKLPGKTEEDVQTCNLMPRNYRVESTIIHPNVYQIHFNSTTLPAYTPYDDICLVRVQHKIDFDDRVRPICLPTYKKLVNRPFRNKNLLVAGWGVGGEVSNEKPPNCTECVKQQVLQKAYMPVVPKEKCQTMNWWVNITDNHLCVGGAVKNQTGVIRQSCVGDSGGPGFKRIRIHRGHQWSPNGTETYFLFGVVSNSYIRIYPKLKNTIYCGTKKPNIMTKVSSYVKWILDNLLEDNILDPNKDKDPRFNDHHDHGR